MSERAPAPEFLRQFSKEAPEQRSEIAAEVLASRKREQLQRELDRLTSPEAKELISATHDINAQIEELRAKLEALPETNGETPENLLSTFYEKEQARWEAADVNWEEIDKYFSAESLAKLDLNDYVKLLRRFPQEMVTHVSRRGIRDHYDFNIAHDTGFDKFNDSFDKMLEQGQILSPYGVKLEQDSKYEFVAKRLGLHEGVSREKALQMLEDKLSETGWATFDDFSATHFAVEQVVDHIYGAETGNEVFVVYPSALIASEYDFGGHYSDLSKPNTDTSRNDVWIWSKETEGIPVDAGIVFLPSDANVDPETGSKYAIDADRNPLFYKERVDTLLDLANNENVVRALEETTERLFELPSKYRNSWDSETGYGSEYDEEERGILATLKEQLEKEGLDAVIAELVVKNSEQVKRDVIDFSKKSGWKSFAQSNAENLLRDAGMYYRPAEDAIDSKSFWEDYFKKYPDRKPSKIVYYKGGDPTAAFKKWREEQGIVRKASEFGIDYKNRSYDKEGATPSKTSERFRSVAMEIIDRMAQPSPIDQG